jgi:hypothetical protein
MKDITSIILDRLYSRAEARMFQDGWSQNDISVFLNDPVIRLIYGACAEEIGKVHEEVNLVGQELIKKTIAQFLPEEFHIPVPAHAIFYASPLEKVTECTIGPDYQFTLLAPDRDSDELMFTPAGNISLSQASISYMVFRKDLFQIRDGKKALICSSSSAHSANQDDLFWIGITDLDKILPREELSIFFNYPQTGNELFSFLNAFKFCTCSDGTNSYKITSGLPGSDTLLRENFLTRPDFMVFKLFQDARNFYMKHFITLNNLQKKKPGQPAFPKEISNAFESKDLEKIKGDIYWLKFKFSTLLKESWMMQMFCSLNCFPALNLKIEQEQLDVENMPINVFPITCNDYILTVKGISGKMRSLPDIIEYDLLNADSKETVGREGQAIFKKGGLRRFDPIKLKSMLNHLSNVLKEETVLLTKDGTKEDLEKLNRLGRAVTEFENCIQTDKSSQSKFSASVVLKPHKDHIRIFIQYWSTVGEAANQIAPVKGDDNIRQCEIFYGPDLKADQIKLITPVTGGKKQSTDEEHMDIMRKLLLTRGRIVTAEDIKVFCYEYFSPRKIFVEVEKNYIQSLSPGQGIIKVVDIHVRIPERGGLNANEIVTMKEQLLQKLEQNSANNIPFRVEISIG